MHKISEHSFHIPVMGLAFTIDTPVKVARFGISSAISIIEDRLIEMMRKHYYPSTDQAYFTITRHEPDFRAKRITDYLNLVNTIVRNQIEKLRNEAFTKGSDIVRYFEMLPGESGLRKLYQLMLQTSDKQARQELQNQLRTHIRPGSIDVNIMTKTDRPNYDKSGKSLPNGSDAVSALRGFIQSNLNGSSVIFSAGMNPRLFSYLENCDEFLPDENLNYKKKVTVKVSDFRSAQIQGKFLARKGIWVSEFRIESGLNCGGHAFATDGYLLGPILHEFKVKRQELIEGIFEIYSTAIFQKTRQTLTDAPEMSISVQGGIGTFEEDSFLRKHYNLKSTGWGTPFLLVPEATTVDEQTLKLLQKANEKDVVLSNNSPLGVRFFYLRGTTSDLEKSSRINNGKPGSPCTEKHLAFNTEFTEEPICTASYRYQKLKLNQLNKSELPESEIDTLRKDVLAKECLCVGLSNSASLVYNENFLGNKLNAVTICPGPNIINFSRIVSLQTMTDHIYGRKNILKSPLRSHMFITELELYINFLKEEIQKNKGNIKKKQYFEDFIQNLVSGINYYLGIYEPFIYNKSDFFKGLIKAQKELKGIRGKLQFSV